MRRPTRNTLRALLLASAAAGGLGASPAARAEGAPRPVELHQRIVTEGAAAPAATTGPTPPTVTAPTKPLALTLDACSGPFDRGLAEFLVRERIPATLFVTRRWLRANPQAVAWLRQHLDVFQFENHGAQHVPAIIGTGRRVYGLAGHADLQALRAEVQDGAQAVAEAFGREPRWYRAATALYDPAALDEIARLGVQVAGFSVNADAGASLPRRAVEQRVRAAQAGDIVIAHLNHPASGTREGLMPALLALRAAGHTWVRLDQVNVKAVK